MSASPLQALLDLALEIQDSDEGKILSRKTFLLFSESIPSQNLGFVDSKATVLDLTINGRDLTIHQSPTILSSTRDGGTTGAVVWKITPLISTWLISPLCSLPNTSTTILELGGGISGITALTISPQIKSYILTDQSYIMKYLHQNLLENRTITRKSKKGASSESQGSNNNDTNIVTFPLDWESDDIPSTLTASNVSTTDIDIVLACDCIYNSHLVLPLVSTCASICRLRSPSNLSNDNQIEGKPTICIIAQQLRSPEIFEEWLSAFMREFRVWRVGDEALIEGLRTGSGFVVHIGILK